MELSLFICLVNCHVTGDDWWELLSEGVSFLSAMAVFSFKAPCTWDESKPWFIIKNMSLILFLQEVTDYWRWLNGDYLAYKQFIIN